MLALSPHRRRGGGRDGRRDDTLLEAGGGKGRSKVRDLSPCRAAAEEARERDESRSQL